MHVAEVGLNRTTTPPCRETHLLIVVQGNTLVRLGTSFFWCLGAISDHRASIPTQAQPSFQLLSPADWHHLEVAKVREMPTVARGDPALCNLTF